MRLATTQGDLVRRGFRDLTTATALVEQLSERHQDGARHFLDLAGEAIDPDLALAGLARLLDADPPRVHSLVEQPAFASRVVAVLGGSTELSRGLVAQPLGGSGAGCFDGLQVQHGLVLASAAPLRRG